MVAGVVRTAASFGQRQVKTKENVGSYLRDWKVGLKADVMRQRAGQEWSSGRLGVGNHRKMSIGDDVENVSTFGRFAYYLYVQRNKQMLISSDSYIHVA